MYKRNAQGWSKHSDFMIVDEISLQIAFILATFIRNHIWAYSSPLYRAMGVTQERIGQNGKRFKMYNVFEEVFQSALCNKPTNIAV